MFREVGGVEASDPLWIRSSPHDDKVIRVGRDGSKVWIRFDNRKVDVELGDAATLARLVLVAHNEIIENPHG